MVAVDGDISEPIKDPIHAPVPLAEELNVGLLSLNVQRCHSEVDTTEQVPVQKSAVFVFESIVPLQSFACGLGVNYAVCLV